MDESGDKKGKISKKDRQRDLRNDGLKKVGGVDFSAIVDRQVGDTRFERERAEKIKTQTEGVSALRATAPKVTAPFDAFTRLAAGLEGRKIADKLADPNRPTWEQYKKDNEDKLDMVGGEMRKMVEYRAELDRERDRKLSQHSQGSKKTTHAISDNEDDDSSSDDSSEDSGKKKKSKKEKSKKHKKDKKKHKVSELCMVVYCVKVYLSFLFHCVEGKK